MVLKTLQLLLKLLLFSVLPPFVAQVMTNTNNNYTNNNNYFFFFWISWY